MNDQYNDKRRGGKAGGGKPAGGRRIDASEKQSPAKDAPRHKGYKSESFHGSKGRENVERTSGVRHREALQQSSRFDRDQSTAAPRDERPRSGTSGTNELERIAKVMARAGLCSRREAEEWILGGRVSVNGRPISSPALDVGPKDVILVDNKPLPTRERSRLWLYHKPRGLVTTADDPEGRPTVFENLPPELPRVISVGRLDINTEGLLLLTNDGGLARVLSHPTTGWLRRYRVRVHGDTNQAALDGLRDGISLDGVDYEPIVATFDRKKGDNAWLTMDLTEGKNREVKRVLEHLGLQVSRLIRISFGPFHLGEMKEGAVEEIRTRMLKDQLGPRLMEEAGVDFDAPVFQGSDVPADEPRKKRYLSREGFQERRRKAVLGEDAALKVERDSVADRKGRQVKVERIRVLRPEIEDAPSEPPRHRRDSGDRPRRPSQRGDVSEHKGQRNVANRNGRTDRSSDERPSRDFASGRGRREASDSPPRSFGNRDQRSRTENDRGFGGRSSDGGASRRGRSDRAPASSEGRGDRNSAGKSAGGLKHRPNGFKAKPGSGPRGGGKPRRGS